MKTDHKNIVQRCQVLIIVSLYLLSTLPNIFFLSNITTAPSNNGRHISLKDTHSKNNVIRADKAIFKEPQKCLPADLPLISLNSDLLTNDPVYSAPELISTDNRPLFNHRYTYLSFLNLRI